MTQNEHSDISSRSSEQKTELFQSSRSDTDTLDPTRSVGINKLTVALGKAQAAIKAPERNREVKVTPRDSTRQSYSFKYATLDQIIEALRKPLTDNGLWFTQIMKLSGGVYVLDTRLLHESGQWLACQTPLILGDRFSNQDFGSALTFMRRYSLTTLLGLAAEEDDDANTADGNTINETKDRSRKPTAPKADVITSGPQDGPGEIIKPYRIDAPMKEDGSGVDWMVFGKTLMALMKMAPLMDIQKWRDENSASLKAMTDEAPKMFANLSTAINKLMSDKEKSNG